MAPPKHYLILPLLLLPYANICKCKRHCGLMVSALVSWASHSHSASLHPGVHMGTGEFNAMGYPAMIMD